MDPTQNSNVKPLTLKQKETVSKLKARGKQSNYLTKDFDRVWRDGMKNKTEHRDWVGHDGVQDWGNNEASENEDTIGFEHQTRQEAPREPNGNADQRTQRIADDLTASNNSEAIEVSKQTSSEEVMALPPSSEQAGEPNSVPHIEPAPGPSDGTTSQLASASQKCSSNEATTTTQDIQDHGAFGMGEELAAGGLDDEEVTTIEREAGTTNEGEVQNSVQESHGHQNEIPLPKLNLEFVSSQYAHNRKFEFIFSII